MSKFRQALFVDYAARSILREAKATTQQHMDAGNFFMWCFTEEGNDVLNRIDEGLLLLREALDIQLQALGGHGHE